MTTTLEQPEWNIDDTRTAGKVFALGEQKKIDDEVVVVILY